MSNISDAPARPLKPLAQETCIAEGYCLVTQFNGLFTLMETDSGTDLDSDSKPNGYIALCRTRSYCTDPYSLCLGQESKSKVCTRVHLRQYK